MSVIVITGVQAAGKSTVAQLLAESFPHSVHLRGDSFRCMIVNGRATMGAQPSGEALAQLHLRYRLAATAASQYADAGFMTVLQDIALGPHLTTLVGLIDHRPLHVVVLAPDVATVRARDAERQRTRGKVAYRPGLLEPEHLDHVLRHETPRRGLWLDTSRLDPEQTVAAIRANLAASVW